MRDGIPLVGPTNAGWFLPQTKSPHPTHIAHTVARDALREDVIAAAREAYGIAGGGAELHAALDALDAHQEAGS